MNPANPARADSTNRRIAAARCVWLGLFLVHLPIFARLLPAVLVGDVDVATTGSLLGLAATTTFFLLKTLDVRWLRLNSRRGSLIAVLLIAAIAHHEVLPAANEPLALVVSVTAVSAGVLISGRWRHLAGAFLAMTPPLLATPTGVIEPERFSGRTHRGGFARAPRAPPH